MTELNKTWITSDHHFFHKNILKYSAETRPFSSLDEMHAELIARHNSVVGKKDKVYFLGDFSFGKPDETLEVLRSLNGVKHLIFGNHDYVIKKNDKLRDEFAWCRDYYELRIPVKSVPPAVLFHFPIMSWHRIEYGAPHLYGHTHGSIATVHNGQGMDVGIDTNNCYPYLLADVIKLTTIMEPSSPRARGVVL